MEPKLSEPLFHVVCRDCAMEEVGLADDAIHIEREHADETDHQVAFGRIV